MSKIGGLYRRLIRWGKLQAYKAEYYLESRADYIWHCLRGGSPQSRLSHYSNQNWHEADTHQAKEMERVAFFVAYHPNEDPPKSNIRYIKSLKECGFSIVYIHNGPLRKDAIHKLKTHCTVIICRENVGQDFGAWKDIYLEYRRLGKLDKASWLLMCNDSNYFTGGMNGESFIHLMNYHLSKEEADLICLNLNQEMWPHYQSFFLCFHNRLFTSENFYEFWYQYKPITNRYHAINSGEIKLSSDVLRNSKAAVLYESAGCSRKIMMAFEDSDILLNYIPKHCFFLVDQLSSGNKLSDKPTEIGIHRVIALLELYNPSHALALLFVKYNMSPFLKKDLVKHGVFSITQISYCLERVGILPDDPIYKEIIDSYLKTSSHVGFVNRRKQAYRQGINPENGVQFTIYRDSLKGLGFKAD